MAPLMFMRYHFLEKMMKKEGHAWGAVVYEILLSFYEEYGDERYIELVKKYYYHHFPGAFYTANPLPKDDGSDFVDPFMLNINDLYL
jgi:hypothetical protein